MVFMGLPYFTSHKLLLHPQICLFTIKYYIERWVPYIPIFILHQCFVLSFSPYETEPDFTY